MRRTYYHPTDSFVCVAKDHGFVAWEAISLMLIAGGVKEDVTGKIFPKRQIIGHLMEDFDIEYPEAAHFFEVMKMRRLLVRERSRRRARRTRMYRHANFSISKSAFRRLEQFVEFLDALRS